MLCRVAAPLLLPPPSRKTPGSHRLHSLLATLPRRHTGRCHSETSHKDSPFQSAASGQAAHSPVCRYLRRRTSPHVKTSPAPGPAPGAAAPVRSAVPVVPIKDNYEEQPLVILALNFFFSASPSLVCEWSRRHCQLGVRPPAQSSSLIHACNEVASTLVSLFLAATRLPSPAFLRLAPPLSHSRSRRCRLLLRISLTLLGQNSDDTSPILWSR
ncbi:hypothetical protein AAHA92_33799 [Salvia divinorum]|uniref:Uncharacterized protein n=1 Tax=Salvia divinorum TaxID=28513 RepID=A0ABD1FGV3_SALDI